MKQFAVGLLLFSSVASAQGLKISVKDFNFSYQNPHGQGSASHFSQNSLIDESVNISVDRIDQNFNIAVSGAQEASFEFKNAPALLTEAETMSLSAFNLDLDNSLNLTMASAQFNGAEDVLKLDGLFLNCNRVLSSKEEMDQLINGCMQKMVFKTSKFSSSSAKAALQSILETSVGAVASDLGVKSVDLRTTNGKYELSAEVKAQISGKVKSQGNMSYDEQTGKITLKISSVKFSFFDITGKVFDELKKQQSPKLQVKEPYVYYSVK